MLISQIQVKLRALQKKNDYPGMVKLLTKFCDNRGYIPKKVSMEEMVIGFLSGGFPSIGNPAHSHRASENTTLTYEYGLTETKAGLFRVDMRHFKEFVS